MDEYDILLTLAGVTAQPVRPWSHAQPEQWCSDGALCRMHIKISTVPVPISGGQW